MTRRRLRARVNWAMRWGSLTLTLFLVALVCFSFARQVSGLCRTGRGVRLIWLVQDGELRIDRDPTCYVGPPTFEAQAGRRRQYARWPDRYRFIPTLFDLSPGVWVVLIPLGLPTLCSAAVTGAFWLRRPRARAAQACPSCRYDLSGLPPGSPCPECAARPMG